MIPKKPKTPKLTIRERKKELTLALLKSAARKVFYEKPYEEVSVEEIAAEAGVSRGTVYLHFSTKRDMLWDLLTDDLRSQMSLYERLSHIPKADRASILQWLKEYRTDFDSRRKSMDLFGQLFRGSQSHIIVAHRDEAIEKLGHRFAAFRLTGLRPASAAHRRVCAHMLLFQLEEATFYFSASPNAPDFNIALNILADRILAFIEGGD